MRQDEYRKGRERIVGSDVFERSLEEVPFKNDIVQNVAFDAI